MKKYLLRALFLLVLGLSSAPLGHAATFISLIASPADTFATDTRSGNGIDYAYEHDLSELAFPDTVIHSGSLELTHLGNQDLGPTAEIWHALSGNGTLIGRLGNSNASEHTDHWELPQNVLDDVTFQNPWALAVQLSEQTSFN